MKNNKNMALLITRRQLLVWTAPTIAVVSLPAHAQTSVVLPPCPSLVLDNLTFSAGSAPGTCGLSFSILSGDAAQSVDIIEVSNTTPTGTDMINYAPANSGQVTSTAGLTVIWLGQAVGAPFACANAAPVPINEITFTVTYRCSINPDVQTVTFTLSEAAAI